jgi:predicted CXXCH cytochrome family protein
MRMGIQCERCHGPGEAHVHAAEQHRSAAGTLRNAPGQSAAAVSAFCGECHRTQSPAFLKPDAPALVRFAPVGLGRSRCFRESAGRLSCLSCHDPHQDTEPNPQRVEAVCRSCHDAGHGAKSCPTNKVSGCVACHMPKVEAAPHSFFTDHWIRPRRDPGVPPPASHQVFGLRRPAKG